MLVAPELVRGRKYATSRFSTLISLQVAQFSSLGWRNLELQRGFFNGAFLSLRAQSKKTFRVQIFDLIYFSQKEYPIHVRP